MDARALCSAGRPPWRAASFLKPASAERQPPPRSPSTDSGPALAIAARGRGGNDPDAYLEGLALDLEAVAGCRAEHGERVSIAVYETRLPVAPGMIALIKETADQAEQGQLFPFFEVGMSGDWRSTVAHAVQGCAASGRAGLKLRCGGLEAAAFPDEEQVAAVIEDCAVARVPLKFTAGLHHPLRRFDKTVQTTMHGFINVFVAGVLATEHRLAEPNLRELLLEEDPAAFRWDADSLGWREWNVRTAEVELARQYSVTSFGSCSFEEPCDDLRAWAGGEPREGLTMNPTNDPALRSWLPVGPASHFPIQNLPYGIFRRPGAGAAAVGVAIGAHVLDLAVLEEAGLLDVPLLRGQREFAAGKLNPFLALGPTVWTETRAAISRLLRADEPALRDNARWREQALIPQRDVEMLLPADVGDYTDFYSSREHATNVGTMLRGTTTPCNPTGCISPWRTMAGRARSWSPAPRSCTLAARANRTRPMPRSSVRRARWISSWKWAHSLAPATSWASQFP